MPDSASYYSNTSAPSITFGIEPDSVTVPPPPYANTPTLSGPVPMTYHVFDVNERLGLLQQQYGEVSYLDRDDADSLNNDGNDDDGVSGTPDNGSDQIQARLQQP